MDAYSPFGGTLLRDLTTANLHALREAREGWYIEYKRETPNAVALAKSLSAFANTYGGWLFLGVEEASKENPVAGRFLGIAKEDVDASLQRMRKSAADHLNPTPHFETVVLWGPDADTALPEDRAVICAWVPQSASAPHVHKTGQVYRRVADASEPKPETDRFTLDQLWRRGEDVKRRHKEWYENDPEFSDAEKEKPYMRLMLIADRWWERNLWLESDDDVRAALSANSGISEIPFDTIYTSAEGFVGRQLNGNDPYNLSLTWRLRRNLVSDVLVPLPLYVIEHTQQLDVELDGYSHGHDFISLLDKHKTSTLRIVDLNYAFNILIGVASIQERLCKLASWPESYFVKVKLLNAWRTIPFVDVQEVLQRFVNMGLPMCLDSVACLPRGTDPANYGEISRYSDVDEEAIRPLLQGLMMFRPLAIAFGVPPWMDSAEDGSTQPYYQALQEAGVRAIEVQRRRNYRLAR